MAARTPQQRPPLGLQAVNPDDYADPAPAPAAFTKVNADDYADRPEAEEHAPSKTESFLRGAAQGATLGLADEGVGVLQGGWRALTSDQSFGDAYREARDESRTANKAAEDANGGSYLLGNLAGGVATAFVPGLNVAKAAGAGGAILRGAATGALAGFGSSDADVTQGEIGKAALDTALGGGLGGVVGGVSHGVSSYLGKGAADKAREFATSRLAAAQALGKDELAAAAKKYGSVVAKDAADGVAAAKAPELAEKAAKGSLTDRAIESLKDGAQNITKVRVFGERGRNLSQIKGIVSADREFRTAIDVSDDKALDVVGKRLSKYGDQADHLYAKVQDLTPGAPLDSVTKNLQQLEKVYDSNPATKKLAREVGKINHEIWETYRDTNVVKRTARIPLSQEASADGPVGLRQLYRSYQDRGYSGGNMFSVSEEKQLQREVSEAIREALHKEVERVASRNPSMGPALENLKAVNRKITAYKGVETLLSEKVTREAAGAKTMTQMLSPLQHLKEGTKQLGIEAMGGASVAATKASQRLENVVGNRAANVLRFPLRGAPQSAAAMSASPGTVLRGVGSGINAAFAAPDDEEEPTYSPSVALSSDARLKTDIRPIVVSERTRLLAAAVAARLAARR